MSVNSHRWMCAQSSVGLLFTPLEPKDRTDRRHVSRLARAVYTHLNLPTRESSTVDEEEDLRSRSPSPLRWHNTLSSQDEASTEQICFLLNSQNVYEGLIPVNVCDINSLCVVERAMDKQFAVIHIHSQCNALKQQASGKFVLNLHFFNTLMTAVDVGRRLRQCQRQGILTSILSLFLGHRFRNSSNAWPALIMAASTLGAVYASIVYYNLCRRTRWARSVDYTFIQLRVDEVCESYLVRNDVLFADEVQVDGLPPRTSWLSISMYALTLGSSWSWIRSCLRLGLTLNSS